MPTRILSWQQLVLENDPDWIRQSLNPVVWEFSNGRRFVDPAQVYAPLPSTGLINDGGLLILDPAFTVGWSTSDAGLPPGSLWANGGNGGVITVVPGGSPQPGSAPMFFGQVTSDQVLLFGANSFPLSGPTAGTLQLWNNGGVICIA